MGTGYLSIQGSPEAVSVRKYHIVRLVRTTSVGSVGLGIEKHPVSCLSLCPVSDGTWIHLLVATVCYFFIVFWFLYSSITVCLPCKDTQFSLMDSLLPLFIFYLLFFVVANTAFLGSTWNDFSKCSCWKQFAAGGMVPGCDTAQFLHCHFKDFILPSIS